ncbi:PREDICTED: uncharacterized protein LOC105314285 [Amphimedon queenslandica]|uniref:Nucleolar 27S pre-rRNA processing Urb2/Npa2 C-terminal domain-containing protein n=1 Tax=Amphimedon queenslandica TaxID=400682 RepID=A0A1X7VSE6_AMPQE|nr:PREDICTED: uncharacterized protein LOC105314285 [Amphimedon queenslandica]|eukprot:XP_019856054.1 PREDICTED: uncharacterized protein LOC105314285 [Amphimedon queenslandica]
MWAEINESSLGVKERLKTAAQIWSSLEAGKDKGKRVGLVQWSIDLLISLYGGKNKKSKKIEIKRRDLCRCWSFLVDCLKDIRDEEREWITFTPLFIEILSVAIKEGMEDEEAKNIIFKCVEAIFLWRPVPAVIMRHDLMLPLVIALLCDVQFCYNNVELINIALKHQSYLQRIHSNPRKVYSSICNNLSSFLSLVHQQDKTFRSSIEDILGYLFTSDFLPEYGSVLALEATPTLGLATPTSFVNQMFDTLSQISEHSSSLIVNGALPFMFEILLKQNKVTGRKLHKEKEFLFFLKLLQTLGVHITMAMVSKEMKEEGEREEEETGEENKGEEDMTVVDNYIESKSHLRSINQVSLMMESVIGSESDPVLDNIGKLLSLLKEYGVYQITEDKDDGQFQKLQLLSNIISMKTTLNNIDTVFMCLESMLRLNHLLIEPLLPDIWSLLLTLPKELVENGKFIANFSDTVASFYGKLRQIPLFLSCVLGSIKVSQEAVKQLGIKPLFYQSTEKILSMLLRILPVAQSLEIFDSFLKHFKEIQLPLVDQITATKRSSAKKRRRESNSSSLIAPHASSSSVLSGLLMSMDAFSLFISNIPLDLFCKGRQHEGMREKLTGIVNEVYTPLLLATLQNADFLFPAVLYFQLIQTKYYHSVSTIERGAESIKRMNHSSVQLSWSPTNDLCLLYNGEALPMPSTLLPISEYLMRCLCVLELRFTKETSLQIEGTLNHLLSVPLSSTSSLTNWNGQILSINAANVTAAVHLLLFKNLPFLYSMMESCPSSSPFDQLATIIHKSLIQCTDPDPDTDTDSDSDSNEVCRVIQELLLSDSYSQMKSLHVSLVKCVSGHMYSLWPKKYSKVIKNILSCDDEVNSPPIQCLISDDERIIKKLETFIQHLTPSLMIMESVPLSFSQENDIFIVKVLTILIHWSMTALVLVNSSIILNHQEPVVHLLLLLARTSEVTLLNRKKEKRKSYDHKNHRRDWGSACKWFKELLTELEEKDEELSQKSCDLKSAVLFSMEMLLKLELLTNPVSDEKKKRQDTPTVNGECITYWNSIEEQVITNVSPNGPIPQSSPLSLLSVLSTDESFIFLLASQSSILELLSTETPMEEQLIGLLLSEKDGGRGSISHYNALCRVQLSLKALMDDTDAMDQVLESSFIQSPTDFDGQLCFCLLWLMFLKLSSSISHEKRVLTRHWLGKVVTKCVHILISQQSFLVTNKRNALIKLSVQLLTQLASLPRQVGLDAQMLHVLYHGLSIINESCIKDCSVLLATESLILVLVQTHSQTLSLSPLMTVIFKFICVIVSLSQELTAVGSTVNDGIKLCISTLNNLMELFCRQEWFAKFAVHCVAQYITNIKLSPIQPEIKGLLLNGVFYLIKILSSADISFLKNSVNDETCSFFQELLQQHKKFNRFKGKI